ncbi:MAG: hypothetical protein K6C94_06290 [Candidatus Gastranaerophilales bacterium]|nr:hypothetical protein [Candidatus Gastranaerophilales bacterium]
MKEKLLQALKVAIGITITTVLLFILLDWIVFSFFYTALDSRQIKPDGVAFCLNMKNITYEKLKKLQFPARPIAGENYKKPGIIMFGCSYGYGSPYKNIEPTLQYKLSEKLKVPVYNRSNPGYAPQMAIFQIRSHEFDNEIKNCKYAMYVTIGEHFWRVYAHSAGWWVPYTWPTCCVKNGELVEKKSKFPVFDGSYIYKYIKKLLYAATYTKQIENGTCNPKIKEYMCDFYKLHFETINKELKKINPDIQFVILVYKDQYDFYAELPIWNDLEKEGIKVVKVCKELPELPGEMKDGYMYPNDGHPTEKAWIKVADLLVDKKKILQ